MEGTTTQKSLSFHMLTPWSLNKTFLLLFACLLFAVLGTKPRALHMLSEHSTTRLYPQQNEIFLRGTLASQLFSCNSLRVPPISEVLTVHWMNACLANVRSTHAKNQGLQKRINKQKTWMMQHSPCLQGCKTGSRTTKTSVNRSCENWGGSLYTVMLGVYTGLHLSGTHNWNG